MNDGTTEKGIFMGAAAPEKIQLRLRVPKGIDATAVVSVRAEVYPPGKGKTSWIFQIHSSTTASRLVLERTFSEDRRDVPIAGMLKMGLFLTFPGDVVRRSKPIAFPVEVWP